MIKKKHMPETMARASFLMSGRVREDFLRIEKREDV
jgi:hypothetical protein